MRDFKIWVENNKDRKKVLKKMKNEGIKWIGGSDPLTGDVKESCPIGFHVSLNGGLTFSGMNQRQFFNNSPEKELSVDEYLGNNVIVIYRNGNKVVAKNKLTGFEAEAKCHPDDKFDFITGAKLALERLSQPDQLKYYNGKVVCIKSVNRFTTKGKIYQFVDGISIDDYGCYMPKSAEKTPIVSVDDLNSLLFDQFIEIVE